MTSYALSLTGVVVDPWRLDLACCKNGGKASGQYRSAIEINTIKTMSLARVVTEETVPGASLNLLTVISVDRGP